MKGFFLTLMNTLNKNCHIFLHGFFFFFDIVKRQNNRRMLKKKKFFLVVIVPGIIFQGFLFFMIQSFFLILQLWTFGGVILLWNVSSIWYDWFFFFFFNFSLFFYGKYKRKYKRQMYVFWLFYVLYFSDSFFHEKVTT